MPGGETTVPMDATRIGIFISTRDRPAYTRRSLDSLRRNLPGPGARIYLGDDGSAEFGAPALAALDALRAVHPALRVFKNARSVGISRVVGQFVTLAGILGVDHLCIVDNDIVYGRGWFAELVGCYEHFAAGHPRAVVTALNVPKHLAIPGPGTTDRFVRKASIGGACWFASLATMRELLTADVADDWDVVCLARLRRLGGVVGCTRRSFVQHIGAFGLHSRGWPDRGVDFVGEGR